MSTIPNICFVVAYKDEDGTFTPCPDVYVEIEDAIQEACASLDEDPTCDPKVVQVILDPLHPSLVFRRLAAEIQDEIAEEVIAAEEDGLGNTTEASPYIKGLQRALELTGSSSDEMVLTVDDLEEGANRGH